MTNGQLTETTSMRFYLRPKIALNYANVIITVLNIPYVINQVRKMFKDKATTEALTMKQ